MADVTFVMKSVPLTAEAVAARVAVLRRVSGHKLQAGDIAAV